MRRPLQAPRIRGRLRGCPPRTVKNYRLAWEREVKRATELAKRVASAENLLSNFMSAEEDKWREMYVRHGAGAPSALLNQLRAWFGMPTIEEDVKKVTGG